jgi:hypothetical protein
VYFRKKLNPHKHLFMNKNLENRYESYAWVGRVFEIKTAAVRQPSIKLTEGVATVIFDAVRKAHPEQFKFGLADYDAIRQHSWWVYDVNIDSMIEQIAEELMSHFRATYPKLKNPYSEKFLADYLADCKEKKDIRNFKIEDLINGIASHQQLVLDKTTLHDNETVDIQETEVVEESLEPAQEIPKDSGKFKYHKSPADFLNKIFTQIHT